MLSVKTIKNTAMALIAAMGISLGATSVASANPANFQVADPIFQSEQVVNYSHHNRDRVSDEEAAAFLTILVIAAANDDDYNRGYYDGYRDAYYYR